MSPLVNYETRDGIAVLELHNPPANAYSYDMFRELDEAILRARMDDGVHVILVRGAGDKFFCAGADIEMLERSSASYKYYFCLHANETLLRLEHTPKLVIAAINGHCVGGGLEVAMAADLRVAAAGGGKLGLPEIGLGVLPGTGGTQRLSRLVGSAKAIELMTTGERIGVEAAASLGLVTEVLSGDDFTESALSYARGFCPPGRAAKAAGYIKRAVKTGSEIPLESGLALERELQQQLFRSDDAAEGLAAFSAKRPPSFSGS